MDWQSFASIAVERMTVPAIVIRPDGVIAVASRTFGTIVGVPDVVGHGIGELIEWVNRSLGVEEILDASFRGAISDWECVARRTSIERVRMRMNVMRFGLSGEDGLLVQVESATSESVFAPSESVAYYDVAVDCSPHGLRGPRCDESVASAPACHQLIYGLDSPCDNCPVLGEERPWPRIAMRPPSQVGHPWLLVVAENKLTGTTRVWLHVISEDILTEIVRAKVRSVIRTARLTDREQEVIDLMLIGRGPDEIATVLDLSSRTVRFHQRNILEKIGADNKLDLFRLLL